MTERPDIFTETPQSSCTMIRSDIPSLQNMPAEIILLVLDALLAEHPRGGYTLPEVIEEYSFAEDNFTTLTSVRNAVHLGATCRKLYAIINPAIIKHNIEINHSSALVLSAKRGTIEGVANALHHGEDVNAPDRTIFHHFRYRSEVEENALDHTRFPTFSSLTSLHWACFHGNTLLVSFLIRQGADVLQRADLGFQYYREEYDGKLTTWWEEEKLDHNHPQRSMFCYSDSEYEAFNEGPDEHAWDDPLPLPVGANALFFALKGSLALSHKRRRETQLTPYPWLIYYADAPYDSSIPMVAEDNSGCRLAIAKALIHKGSSLITRQKDSIHALHQACTYREVEIAEFLLREMAVDPNVRDAKGMTSLHYLAVNLDYGPARRTKKMFELLLQYRADITLIDVYGLNAMDYGLPQTPRSL